MLTPQSSAAIVGTTQHDIDVTSSRPAPALTSERPGGRLDVNRCRRRAWRRPATLSVVRELKWNPRRIGAEMRNHRLQVVALGPRHPQRFALDRRVHLQLQFLDRLLNRLGGILVDTAL